MAVEINLSTEAALVWSQTVSANQEAVNQPLSMLSDPREDRMMSVNEVKLSTKPLN